MRPDRIGLGFTLTLHALAAVALLSYAPARKALLAAVPIMVEIIVPAKPEPTKPAPLAELPAPRPMAKSARHPIEPQLVAAPVEAPAPAVVPPTPAPIEVIATPVPPPPLTQPIFRADYLDNPAPVYPLLSRRMGEQGRVILRVMVNARGAADEVQVRMSSGFARLDESARDTVQRWRFVPARRGAEPVAAWVLIPISFGIEG